MIKIEHTEVMGWEAAIRGMRNPMDSWEKSDSLFGRNLSIPYSQNNPVLLIDSNGVETYIGDSDLDLMMRLRNAGTEHRKFMRMIEVYCDITAPLYWWKEFDTYKVGTVANSCSTMHKIADKKFTLEDFSCEHLLDDPTERDWITNAEVDEGSGWGKVFAAPLDILKFTIESLNYSRTAYLETKDKKYWWQMIQLLPSSYNQKRTVMMNYETLSNIYEYRRDHKLDEWRTLCEWIESLPYSEIITLKEEA